MAKEEPPKTVNVDDLVAQARANLNTVDALPKKEEKEFVQGGAIPAKDGRHLYQYKLDDGTTIVLPKPLEKMTEEDFYQLPISLYDNAPNRLPTNLVVKFKDPQWAGYWFNKKAKDGRRVGEGRALGFVPALIADLDWYASHLNNKDGALEDHDLVLMKIHKAKLYMRYKAALDDAKAKGGINAYKDNAQTALPRGAGDKAEYYHTPHALREFQGVGPVTQLPVHD